MITDGHGRTLTDNKAWLMGTMRHSRCTRTSLSGSRAARICKGSFAVIFLARSLGKGMRRHRNQWRTAPFHWKGSRHSVNEGIGKEFYRLTGHFFITVTIFPGIKFGITLHSLYRKYVSAEIISLYIILSLPRPLNCTSFLFLLHDMKIPEAKTFSDISHHGYT